ncbi:uncharacterized protein LOC127001268 [Eriocheir sinensis]|uniref:uncharacterized protein LOC127001268 n=1 Tax=Eriocheir sinensis TaxID=95602 RepID=UPI0021C779FE|nr:uncharacterized protein LOC127001268 [Eriocheir sinensis]
MRIVRLVWLMLAAAAVVCLPQEVPGLANIEILKIVPRRSSAAAHEPLTLTPTAADRRYDVMIDYDDDYLDEDDGQYKAVATTLERPQPLLTTDLSDYDLTLFQPELFRESNFENAFSKDTLYTSSSPSRESLPHVQGFEEEVFGGSGVTRHATLDRFVAVTEERIDPHTKEQFIPKKPERLALDREERIVPETGHTFIRASGERRPGGIEDRSIPSAERLTTERGERFAPSTENRFVLVTDEGVIEENKGRFSEATDEFSVLHHDISVPDGHVPNVLPVTDEGAAALVTEGSMQYPAVVLPPHKAQRRIGARYLAPPPTFAPRQAPSRSIQHYSRSANAFYKEAQHPRRISPLSDSLHDLYSSRVLNNERSSRALYNPAQHQQDGNPPQLHRSQVPPKVSYPTTRRDTRPSIAEKRDASFQTNRRGRALNILNPSYARLVEAEQNVKRDRAMQARPPVGSPSRDEVAYYTGLQQEIEKSDLLVDAIMDVRAREGKSIQDLKRRRKDTEGSKVVTTPAPDIEEVKQKFGSHPLYQDLPREEDEYPSVRDAGPLLHRDDYSSERDEYEKMYLPVRAKSLELREIRKVKEHFHSLVPLKALKNSHSTSPPRHKPQPPEVTTYKPPVLPEYIKFRKLTSVTTAKPYYETGTSHEKFRHNAIPTPPRSSRLYSKQPGESGHPPTRAPPPRSSSPKVTRPPNSHNPRRSTGSPGHREKDISHLIYPKIYNSPSLSDIPSPHRSHRSSRMYHPQEPPQSGFRKHHSRDTKVHRLPRYQHKIPSSVKSSSGAGHDYPSPPAYSLPHTHPHDPRSTIRHPSPEAKVRHKRGPDMEDYLDAKMRFPKFGYDIDPYFSDFPSFGFFESDAEKKS